MKKAVGAFLLLVGYLGVFNNANADVLAEIKSTGVFKLGYRADAVPFSFDAEGGKPAGYSVELCERVALEIERDLELNPIEIDYIPVTAANRIEMIESGAIHIECGITTNTLARQEDVAFSLLTFITGAEMLIRIDSGVLDLDDIAGRPVGVLTGTTTEAGLLKLMERKSIEAEVVAVDTHFDGIELLGEGKIDAYFADRAILILLGLNSPDRDNLRLSGKLYSHEPYALMLPRGEEEYKILVDRKLARLYRSGKIREIYRRWFGDAQPSNLLQALFVLQGLPE